MKKHTKTVLVVEDEKALLKAWVEIFRKEGLEVLTASSSESALILAVDNHPDLIIIDLVMANSDGLVLTKRLKESSWGSKVPVMYLSGGDAELLENNSYFNNTWSFDQVLEAVREKLGYLNLKQGVV